MLSVFQPDAVPFWPKSVGWLLVNGGVGLAGLIVLIVLLAQATQPFDNRYGPVPGEKVA